MKILLTYLFLLFSLSALSAYGDIHQYQADTVVEFNPSQKTYLFEFRGKSQGLFWDTISNKVDYSAIRFGFVNRSKDTMNVYHVGSNNDFIEFKLSDKAKVASLDTIWIEVTNKAKIKNFYTILSVYCKTKKETYACSITNWGYYVPNHIPTPQIYPSSDGYSKITLINKTKKQLGDLTFMRYVDDALLPIKMEFNLADSNYYFLIKSRPRETVSGYVYSEKYDIIQKIYTLPLYKAQATFEVATVFQENEPYYYQFLGDVTHKVGKTELSSTYQIHWNDTRGLSYNAAQQKVSSILNANGLTEGQIAIASLAKAITLEKKLLEAAIPIHLYPMKYQNPFTAEGWGGGYACYSNSIFIQLAADLTTIEIETFFKTAGISDYNTLNYIANGYHFKVGAILTPTFSAFMNELWKKKEVMHLSQELYGTPDLDLRY